MNRTLDRRLTGHHVLTITVAFFAAVMAVNGAMVWLALDSHPGLSSRDAYREGLSFNQRIDAREAQNALGWRVVVDAAESAGAHAVTATFLDRNGRPLTGLSVSARWTRPVVGGYDRSALLSEIAPGTYRAAISLPAPGKWRLAVAADHESPAEHAAPWRMERELWLK